MREGYIFSRKTLSPQKAREAEQKMSDQERIFTYIKDARNSGRYPTKPLVEAHFMNCGEPIGKERTRRALELLSHNGLMGEKLKGIEHPDQTIKGLAFVITDMEGKEL